MLQNIIFGRTFPLVCSIQCYVQAGSYCESLHMVQWKESFACRKEKHIVVDLHSGDITLIRNRSFIRRYSPLSHARHSIAGYYDIGSSSIFKYIFSLSTFWPHIAIASGTPGWWLNDSRTILDKKQVPCQWDMGFSTTMLFICIYCRVPSSSQPHFTLVLLLCVTRSKGVLLPVRPRYYYVCRLGDLTWKLQCKFTASDHHYSPGDAKVI